MEYFSSFTDEKLYFLLLKINIVEVDSINNVSLLDTYINNDLYDCYLREIYSKGNFKKLIIHFISLFISNKKIEIKERFIC
jgi:hypothetical protein